MRVPSLRDMSQTNTRPRMSLLAETEKHADDFLPGALVTANPGGLRQNNHESNQTDVFAAYPGELPVWSRHDKPYDLHKAKQRRILIRHSVLRS